MKFLKKSIVIALIGASFAAILAPSFAQAQEKPKPTTQEQMKAQAKAQADRARKQLNCAKGMRQFLAALVGFEDFTDYWRDFWIAFNYPMHYADISLVENQVNKARYAVVSTFMRCDLDRLKAVTEAYYRLEAEFYFVRHFIDASGGFVRNKAASEREDFVDEMKKYFVLRKKSGDPQKDELLFSNYFDLFASKYRGRAEQYANFTGDPVWDELREKVDKLVETLEGFRELGNEIAKTAGEAKKALAEGAKSIKTATESFKNPKTVLKAVASGISSRFKMCPTGDHPDDCPEVYEVVAGVVNKVVSIARQVFGPGNKNTAPQKMVDYVVEKSTREKGKPKTLSDITSLTQDLSLLAQESIDRADMAARYETLYGELSGDGVSAMVTKMDDLIDLIGASTKTLATVAQCAEKVQNSVCAN